MGHPRSEHCSGGCFCRKNFGIPEDGGTAGSFFRWHSLFGEGEEISGSFREM